MEPHISVYCMMFQDRPMLAWSLLHPSPKAHTHPKQLFPIDYIIEGPLSKKWDRWSVIDYHWTLHKHKSKFNFPKTGSCMPALAKISAQFAVHVDSMMSLSWFILIQTFIIHKNAHETSIEWNLAYRISSSSSSCIP